MVVFNPKIHNNYLIFAVVLKGKEEEEVVDKVLEMVVDCPIQLTPVTWIC